MSLIGFAPTPFRNTSIMPSLTNKQRGGTSLWMISILMLFYIQNMFNNIKPLYRGYRDKNSGSWSLSPSKWDVTMLLQSKLTTISTRDHRTKLYGYSRHFLSSTPATVVGIFDQNLFTTMSIYKEQTETTLCSWRISMPSSRFVGWILIMHGWSWFQQYTVDQYAKIALRVF